MRISYNRLWKLLIDQGMNRQDLRRVTDISPTSIAKLGKGENVTTDILLKICVALDCNLEDIMESVKDDGNAGIDNSQHGHARRPIFVPKR